jgi:hypothetical protein
MSELVAQINALLALKNMVPHPVPGLARELLEKAVARIEELEASIATIELNDPALRWSSLKDGVAPDGSEWRNITFDGVEYTVPYEVAMYFGGRLAAENALRDIFARLDRPDNGGQFVRYFLRWPEVKAARQTLDDATRRTKLIAEQPAPPPTPTDGGDK